MIVRCIDDIGDWTFGKGKNDYKTDLEAVAQNIKTRLNSYLGDCFFAKADGIDWFNLLGSKSELALLLSMNAVILNTENVIGIISIDSILSRTTRNLQVAYEVQTIFGTVSDEVIPFDFDPDTGDGLLLENGTDFLLTEGGDTVGLES